MTLSDESDEETASLLNNLLGLKNPAPTDEPDWLSSVAPNVSPSKMAFSAARSSRRAPTGSPARPTSNPVVTPEDSPARSRSGTGTMRGKGGKAAARRGGASGSGSEINWDVSQRKLHEGFKRVSVSKEEKEARVFDTLSLADLFAPLLSGSRLMGRAKVTAAAVAAAPPELEVRLEDEWGNAITGGNGKRAHLCLRFDGGVEGTLCVTVVRAVNLPRLDRFASSDPQVTMELGEHCRQTRVIRDNAEPFFRDKLSVPWPPPSPETPLVFTVAHVNRRADVEEISSRSVLEEVPAGQVVLQEGSRPFSLLFLESGTLGVYEKASAHDARLANGERHLEVGRLTRKGVGLGEQSLLCGKALPVSVVAMTAVTVVRTPRAALEAAMHRAPSLCEYLAHTLLDDAPPAVRDESAGIKASAQPMEVTVSVGSLLYTPDHVHFDYASSSPAVLLELEGSRFETKSLRFFLPSGVMPSWNQDFSFTDVKSGDSYLNISLVDTGPGREAVGVVGRTSMRVSDLRAHRDLKQDVNLDNPANAHQGTQRLVSGDDRPLLHPEATQRLQRYVESDGAEGKLTEPPKEVTIDDLQREGIFTGFSEKPRREVDSDNDDERNDDRHDQSGGHDANGGEAPKEKQVRRRTAGGVLHLRVQVKGGYEPGERDLLQVLSLMGFSRSFRQLHDGGLRSVTHLLQDLDDGRLAFLCPDMTRTHRKLFLHRLQKLRLDAFLTPAARELAAAIRQSCGIPPRARHPDEEEEWARALAIKLDMT